LGPRLRFSKTELYEKDWQGANLSGSYFENCDLYDGNFTGAKLTDCGFFKCGMQHSDFTGAELTGASFTDCNLRHAKFRNARLANTDLKQVQIEHATGIVDLGIPHHYRIYLVQHDAGIMIKAGCRWMDYHAAVRYWDNEGDYKPLSGPLLTYIKSIVEIKGWNLGA
jgi:hypothetical protein